MKRLLAAVKGRFFTGKKVRALRFTAAGVREIVMVREFNASRHLVFDALTKPELIKRWRGVFGGWEVKVCEVDLKVGGTYRWVRRNRLDGSEAGLRGVYLQITPYERLGYTELFEQPWYPGGALIATTLAEKGGRTTVTTTLLYESQEARDAVLKSDMKHGFTASYNKLAELLEENG